MTPVRGPRSRSASAYVALLRAINVGGRNMLAMADVARIFVECGCVNVRTYIQSGNVVFAASGPVAGALAESATERIAERFGVTAPVILRSAVDFGNVVGGNPFLKRGTDLKTLHVSFLADKPTPRAVAALDPKRSPGDAFAVRGREIYLNLPNGAGRSKLTTAYFDSTLGTISTVRNWRTVLKLMEMTQTPG